MTAQVDAADCEFETAGRRLTTSVSAFDYGKSDVSLQYVKRSLFFGEKLNKLDAKQKPFTEDEIRDGIELCKEGEWDDLEDRIKQFSMGP